MRPNFINAKKHFYMLVTSNYGMSELMGPGVSGECEYLCGMHKKHFFNLTWKYIHTTNF